MLHRRERVGVAQAEREGAGQARGGPGVERPRSSLAIDLRARRPGHVRDRREVGVDAEAEERGAGPAAVQTGVRGRARAAGSRTGGSHGIVFTEPPSWSTPISSGGCPPAAAARCSVCAIERSCADEEKLKRWTITPPISPRLARARSEAEGVVPVIETTSFCPTSWARVGWETVPAGLAPLNAAIAATSAAIEVVAYSGSIHERSRLREYRAGVIEARNLTKDYGDKRAVDDLTFTVEPGHRDRLPRPERLGQVDDDAPDPRPRRARPPAT